MVAKKELAQVARERNCVSVEEAQTFDDFETAKRNCRARTIGLVHDIPKAGDLVNRNRLPRRLTG